MHTFNILHEFNGLRVHLETNIPTQERSVSRLITHLHGVLYTYLMRWKHLKYIDECPGSGSVSGSCSCSCRPIECLVSSNYYWIKWCWYVFVEVSGSEAARVLYLNAILGVGDQCLFICTYLGRTYITNVHTTLLTLKLTRTLIPKHLKWIQ